MVVAAHPDDETLGAGATIAKHIAAGDAVSVLILGQGITSRKEKNQDSSSEIIALRADSKRALAKLGVKNVKFFDLPDNMFDSVPLLELVKVIEKAISEEKPEIVYTHYHGDLNVDHRLTFNAALTGCRPFNCSVKKILSFEVLSSTEWSPQNSASIFMPIAYVDVSAEFLKKIAALKEYKTEMRQYPHPRSLEVVETLAKFRGATIGVNAAEAFEIIREII